MTQPNKIDWKHLFGPLALFIAIVSCSSEDPEPVDEPELITTLNVTFRNTANASDVVTATFRDLDGAGGNDGTKQNPTLSANATYTVAVEFLNESVTPTDDVTAEVREEDDEHQVFFLSSTGLTMTYAYTDTDGDGNPLGLAGTATTGAASTGTLNVVLVHEPTKTAQGVNTGDITNAGGEEDIRVAFDVTIQ